MKMLSVIVFCALVILSDGLQLFDLKNSATDNCQDCKKTFDELKLIAKLLCTQGKQEELLKEVKVSTN
jgi:hypothetical protein